MRVYCPRCGASVIVQIVGKSTYRTTKGPNVRLACLVAAERSNTETSAENFNCHQLEMAMSQAIVALRALSKMLSRAAA